MALLTRDEEVSFLVQIFASIKSVSIRAAATSLLVGAIIGWDAAISIFSSMPFSLHGTAIQIDLLELVGRFWLAKKVTLNFGAVISLQVFELDFGLHTFCNNLHSKSSSQI